MHEAIAGDNYYLRRGIENMGKSVWPQWLEVYEQRGKYAPRAATPRQHVSDSPERGQS